MSAPRICVPGQRICHIENGTTAGNGTYQRNGFIYSSIAGYLKTDKTDDGQVLIEVKRDIEQNAVPSVDAVVTARVTNVNPRFCKCLILSVGKIGLREPFRGQIRKEDVRATEKDKVEMYKSFRPGDIIVARVLSLGDAHSYLLTTAENELGVVMATSEAGANMDPISWCEMKCPKTLAIEHRKVAKVQPKYIQYTDTYAEEVTYPVDDTSGLGRRFDGIGGLSGGGATSVLLQNYPEQQRNEILDYLFKPNFGASLHLLKVEIGGDAQSTGWIGNGTRDPYTDIELPANYIVKWVLGAKKYHNLTIDFIGIWNEQAYDVKYIKLLRKVLDNNSLQHVRIVAADGGWGIVNDINNDSDLAKAIDYIGVHYPGTESVMSAIQTGKQLWSSEDYSTFNDNIGGGCWARLLNQNYVNGRFTGTISWNLIASYYDALPFARNGLMTANSPWSGSYVVNSPIWMSAHTTQFTLPGWKYLSHGSGVGKLKYGGSYVSLVSPDGKDLTIVIETMSHDHSICVRPPLPAYTVAQQNITIQLGGSFAKITEVTAWYSQLGFDGKNDTFMQKVDIKVPNGLIHLRLDVDQVVTITTIKVGQKGSYPNPPPSKPFPVPYKEDFEAYAVSSQPKYLSQQLGAFEIQKSNGDHGQILRQMVLETPVWWCKADYYNHTLNVIGDFGWTDISVSVDVQIGKENGTDGVFLAARVDKGGCQSFYANGVFFYIFPASKMYYLTYDLSRTQLVAKGPISNLQDGWNNLELIVEGYQLRGSVNGQLTFEHAIDKAPLSGFIGIGTSSYGIADFDNLHIFDTNKSTDISYEEHIDETLYFVPKNKP
ncbi:GALC [Mytilus edulis]|uniref:GALC n=2 Tax=Mytilus TaxID=6548 RepID=A0A8S3T1X1_MYTED|nr:GALC [Mytilus edulis]